MTALLDGRFPVETPEGVTLTLTPAGAVPRALAWLVDLMLRSVAYLAAGLLLSLFGKGGTGLLLVFMFLVEWFYPVLFEVLAGGAIHPEDGFRFAFESGADFICVGMFDWQIVDDVNITLDILGNLPKRTRKWYA